VSYSCEFSAHRRRDSTRQLSRVGGVYWTVDSLLQRVSLMTLKIIAANSLFASCKVHYGNRKFAFAEAEPSLWNYFDGDASLELPTSVVNLLLL